MKLCFSESERREKRHGGGQTRWINTLDDANGSLQRWPGSQGSRGGHGGMHLAGQWRFLIGWLASAD